LSDGVGNPIATSLAARSIMAISFNAIECTETVNGETTTFAWITDLEVDIRKVEDVATKGGLQRWHIISPAACSTSVTSS
jgi:hypothetical protein